MDHSDKRDDAIDSHNKNKNEEFENMSIFIAKGSFLFTSAGIITKALLFALSFIAFRLILSTADIGNYTTILSYYLFAVSFTLISPAREIFIKRLSVNIKNSEATKSLITSFFIFAAVGIVLVLLYFFIVFVTKTVYYQDFLNGLFLISFAVFENMMHLGAYFIGVRQYKKYNIIQILITGIHFIISLILILIFKNIPSIPTYWGLYIGLIFRSIIGSALVIFLIFKEQGNFFSKKIDWKYFLEFLVLGGISILTILLTTNSVTILWRFTQNDDIVGQFSLIQKTGANLTQIVTIFLGAMLLSILPTYLKNQEFAKAEKITGKLGKMIFYIMSLIILVTSLFPDIYIWAFYGTEKLPNSKLLWFSFFQILWAVSNLSVRQIFLSQNKIFYLYIIFILRTGVFYICAYTLTPKFGLNGMLTTIAISYTVNSVINVLITAKAGKVNFFRFYWKLFLIFLGILSLNIVLYYVLESFFWIRIVLIIVTLGLYHLAIVVFGGFVKQDMQYFKDIFNGFRIFQYPSVKKIVDAIFGLLDKIPLKENLY